MNIRHTYYTLCLGLIILMLRQAYAANNCDITQEEANYLDPGRGDCRTLFYEFTKTKYNIKLVGGNLIVIGCYGHSTGNNKWESTQYFAKSYGGYIPISKGNLNKPVTIEQEDGKNVTLIFSKILPKCSSNWDIDGSTSNKIDIVEPPIVTHKGRNDSTPTTKTSIPSQDTTSITSSTNKRTTPTPITKTTKPYVFITEKPTTKTTWSFSPPSPNNTRSTPTPITNTTKPYVFSTEKPTTKTTWSFSPPSANKTPSTPTPNTKATNPYITYTTKPPTTTPVKPTPIQPSVSTPTAPGLFIAPCDCPTVTGTIRKLTPTQPTKTTTTPIQWDITTQPPPTFEKTIPCTHDVISDETVSKIYNKHEVPGDHFRISLDQCTCSCPKSKFGLL